MTTICSDTDPKMEEIHINLLRQATPSQKMDMLAQLNKSARLLALTGLRLRYPNSSEEELRRRLADLLLGKELAMKVFGKPNYEK